MRSMESALKFVYDKTGISGAVYSAFGEKLLSTGNDEFEFRLPPAESFSGNLARSGGVTYLRVRRGYADMYLLLKGDDEVAANYASLIEAILTGEDERFVGETSAEEKLRMLLSGELSSARINVLGVYFAEVKFCHYVMSLVTATAEMQKGVRSLLETVRDKRDYIVAMGDKTLVYLRYAGDEGEEYKSAGDFAAVLYENIKEELRVDLVIATGGTLRSFGELSTCYEKLIFTYRFGRLVNPELNVYNYKDYVLLRMLSETPKTLLARYFDALLEKNCAAVLADEELMNTAEEFMKNSLNISETSRNMYIHRNTLIYRLDKIEKDTGLNLRKFNDAVTFRLINMLNVLIKGE